jgi:hypothetical protein
MKTALGHNAIGHDRPMKVVLPAAFSTERGFADSEPNVVELKFDALRIRVWDRQVV